MRAPDVPPTPDAPRSPVDRRMASLDGLRGVAALAVFVFHGWLYTMPGEPASANRNVTGDYIVHELRLALVSFFVLSGFLLFRPWVKATLGGSAKPDLRSYLRARVARVAPAYYAALLGTIALVWGLASVPGVRLPPAELLPLYAVFAQNFTEATVLKLDPPMWSLAVEVMFYAVLPLLGWLALRLAPTRRAQVCLPLALILIGVVFNLSIAGKGLGLTFSKTLPAMLPYLGLGMLTAVLLHDRAPAQAGRRAMLLGGLGLVATDAVVKALGGASVFDPYPYFRIFRDLPSGIGFALVIAALATSIKQGGMMSGRVLAGVGTISYGFYLWHVPVMWWMRGNGLLPLDPVLGILAALLPSLALALASWFILERPAIRWAHAKNRRVRDERRAREAAAARASGRGDDAVRRGGVGTARA